VKKTSKVWAWEIGVIVTAMGFLAWLGYGESKTYYHTIAELENFEGFREKANGMPHRRHGGSRKYSTPQRPALIFVLEGEGKTLPVSYNWHGPSAGHICRQIPSPRRGPAPVRKDALSPRWFKRNALPSMKQRREVRVALRPAPPRRVGFRAPGISGG